MVLYKKAAMEMAAFLYAFIAPSVSVACPMVQPLSEVYLL